MFVICVLCVTKSAEKLNDDWQVCERERGGE